MLRSYANRLLAVRRVTQLNAGKDTPGVDKLVIKTPKARSVLVDDLRTYQPWRIQPTRRVSIPKASGALRPLGIPTIHDRAVQAMVKNALEPEWEAKFEATSYGFRPGRGCHDAIQKVYSNANAGCTRPWVLDADIQGAFDHVNHAYLLATLGTFPARALIKQWLKAGYVEYGHLHETDAGTPQGGVISPLLLNVALHGMEAALGIWRSARGYIQSPRALVRYADDFVVFCRTKEDAEQAQTILATWLGERGLALAADKTRIVHITEGFDFLGWTVRQFKVTTTPTGYKLLIRPSNESVRRIKERLRQEWQALAGKPPLRVIQRLNPIIRGWANYHRTQVAGHVFWTLDHFNYQRQRKHVYNAHRGRSRRWLRQRYWGRFNPRYEDTWVYGDRRTGVYLLKFKWFTIQRHILVKGSATPDDPTLQEYWRKRDASKATFLDRSAQRIARRQGYRCPTCGETLFNDEELQTHHWVPKRKGGSDSYANLSMQHLYCHQQLHRGTVSESDA
jgi:RNA-directed DNA polymerase